MDKWVISINKHYLKYDVALICWIMYSMFVGATTVEFHKYISNGWYFLSLILLFWNIINIKALWSNYRNILGVLGVLIVTAVATVTSKYPPLFAWALMIISSINIAHEHIVKLYFRCFVFLCVFIPALAITGLIPNYVLDTVGSTGIRTSYGFSHPNVFAASIMICIICWCYLNWKKVKVYQVILISIIGYVIMRLTDSSAATIIIVFITLIALLERWFDKKGKLKIWYVIAAGLLVFCPIASYYLMTNFSMLNDGMLALDLFASGRIRLMNSFYLNYGWSLWGQEALFDMENRSLLLFALDNSYAYLLIQFGLITTLMYYLGIARELKQAVKYSDNRLIICIMTFVIYGLFENYFFKTQFNFTLLFIASSTFSPYLAPQSNNVNDPIEKRRFLQKRYNS